MIKIFKNFFKKKSKPNIESDQISSEFYSVIKLISGEEIFSLVMTDKNNGDPVVILQNPIIMKIVINQKGMFVKAKSWIETSDDNIFIIRMDKIITMSETKDSRLIEIYENYVSNNNEETINLDDVNEFYNSSGKVKPSTKMGYISSVKDARKKLEDIYKSQ